MLTNAVAVTALVETEGNNTTVSDWFPAVQAETD